MYINDLPLCVESKVCLFADDAHLYWSITSRLDPVILQSDLHKLQTWEELWSMEFHPNKCKVLRVTNKTKPITSDYTFHNEKLESVDSEYLGIILNKKLKWDTHVDMVCKKSSRNFLQQNLPRCSSKLRHKVYVNTILNYASTVRNPVGEGNQYLREKLEVFQRKSAQFVYADWSHHSSPSAM